MTTDTATVLPPLTLPRGRRRDDLAAITEWLADGLDDLDRWDRLRPLAPWTYRDVTKDRVVAFATAGDLDLKVFLPALAGAR